MDVKGLRLNEIHVDELMDGLDDSENVENEMNHVEMMIVVKVMEMMMMMVMMLVGRARVKIFLIHLMLQMRIVVLGMMVICDDEENVDGGVMGLLGILEKNVLNEMRERIEKRGNEKREKEKDEMG